MTIVSIFLTFCYWFKATFLTMTLFKMPVLILFLHWLADFVFQSHKMAQNKSTSRKWLLAHALTYGLVMFLGLYFFVSFKFLLYYVGINMLLHYMIDSQTSKITKRLWAEGKVHEFFVMIGWDQFLHYFFLYLTWVMKERIWYLAGLLF